MINKERILSLFSSVDKATLHQTTSGESCSIFSIAWERQLVSLTAIVVEERNLDIYGKIRTGNSTLVPFLFQGQYFDEETDLCYNRFRYYSPDTGLYISQDPIGLAGGMALYSYVHDLNSWIDIFGLKGIIPTVTIGNNNEILEAIATVNRTNLGKGTTTNQSSRAYARSLGNMESADERIGLTLLQKSINCVSLLSAQMVVFFHIQRKYKLFEFNHLGLAPGWFLFI